MEGNPPQTKDRHPSSLFWQLDSSQSDGGSDQEDKKLGLEIAFEGNTGPRCMPTDKACGPEPYFTGPERLKQGEFALPYDPTLPRKVANYGGRNRGGSCKHDGECVRVGNAGCAAWYHPAPEGATHELRTRMLDDYCGCVEGRCTWFTSGGRKITVRADVHVEGWGKPAKVDPKLFEAGFGTGDQVVKACLEGPDLRHQMKRCYWSHWDELPQRLELALTVDRLGRTQIHRLTGASQSVQGCVRQILGWLDFPTPHSSRNSRVKGTLHIDPEAAQR